MELDSYQTQLLI